jgi:glycosyltransferase involved in cell wall biosynthesis
MADIDRQVIVVVSHLCPFPVIHGNRSRLIALLTWLKSKGFRVSYILQPLDVDEAAGVQKLRALVDRLEIVRRPSEGGRIKIFLSEAYRRFEKKFLPGRVAGTLRNAFRRAERRNPIVNETWGTGDVGGDGHIDRWCWSATAEAVQRETRTNRPLAVIAEYTLLSKCLEKLPPSTLKIIDTVEVFFRNRDRFHTEGLAAPFVCTRESEQLALNRGDVLVAIQKNDAHVLRELFPEKRVITLPHTYRKASPGAAHPATGTILYVGSSNPYNVHGLRQFLDQAWPSILKDVPNATLRIVGGIPRIERAHGDPVVHVGRVSDQELAREYQTAHVVINPQVAGTGLKIKCVEALSAGCPLVMNRAAADGLEQGEGTAFLVAKDWPEFADHVVRVLSDDVLRQELAMKAQGFAEEMFSAVRTFSELERVLSERLSALAREVTPGASPGVRPDASHSA